MSRPKKSFLSQEHLYHLRLKFFINNLKALDFLSVIKCKKS